MKQKEISKRVGISESYVSEIINRNRLPSWPVAKRIAEVTGTSPVLWLEGTKDEIRQVLSGAIVDPYRMPCALPATDCECADKMDAEA